MSTTVIEALRSGLAGEMAADPRVVAIRVAGVLECLLQGRGFVDVEGITRGATRREMLSRTLPLMDSRSGFSSMTTWLTRSSHQPCSVTMGCVTSP